MKKGLLLILFVGAIINGFAQPGALDITFGKSGIVQTSFDTGYGARAQAMVIQADGKIVVTGNNSTNIFLTRYKPNGEPDSSFGIAGKVSESINLSIAKAIALQPDGKIVVGGGIQGAGAQHKSFGLIRYNVDGSNDSTFGTYTSWNGHHYALAEGGVEDINAIYITPSGKILTAGGGSQYAGCGLAQFKVDGTLDSTFAINGILRDTFMTSINSIAVLPSGKFVAVGNMNVATDPLNFRLAKFNADGTRDFTFGDNGIVRRDIYGEFLALRIDSAGRFVVAGNAYFGSRSGLRNGIFRFDSTGLPDSSFGINGKVHIAVAIDQEVVNALHILPDGKLLVTGTTGGVLTDFLTIRLNQNGTPDSSFGRKGVVITNLYIPGISQGYDVGCSSAIQPDGKMVIGGYSNRTAASNLVSLVRIERNGLNKYNTIHGSYFFDRNLNGINDIGEARAVPSRVVISKPGVGAITTFSFNNSFVVDIDTGSYITSLVPSVPYVNVIPPSYSTTHTTYNNSDTVSFILQPMLGKRDLTISMFSLRGARTGTLVAYKIFYENIGTDTVTNGTIKLLKTNKFMFNTAKPLPATVTVDTLKWNFSNLKPFDTASIVVYFTVPVPPVVHIGDSALSVATISSPVTDLTPDDNTSTVKQFILGAYDPNDKTENHGGKITTTQVTAGDYLQYTVRFQNTGNDTAFNVYIHDTLDTKLDWNTLQILTASHNYQMTMTEGNKCLFTFRNINLVDSGTNEPGSHGYIVYKIKPKPTVQVGDIINNTAAIYFDYNLPIYTNTEMTRVVADAFPLKLLTFTVRKQNKANLLQWTTANEINVDHFDIERSINGREFSPIGTVKAGLYNYSITDINPLKATNYYRLKMLDKDGQFTYSPIRVINNNRTFSVNIYPNPAKDNLQVEINSDKKASMQIQVLSMDGKVLLNNSLNPFEGSILRSMNISSLQKGSYFLKVISADKEEQVVKFAKQ